MHHDNPIELEAIATRLLAFEESNSSAKNAAVFEVCEKLRGALSQLTGVAGFRSLLSRALALAGGEVAWLRGLHIKLDGSLEGLDVLKAKLEKKAMSQGEIALVARLIGLLVTFIGPALTQRLLQDIWPKIEDLNFETDDANEEG